MQELTSMNLCKYLMVSVMSGKSIMHHTVAARRPFLSQRNIITFSTEH
jgi:hypothetical protein